MNVKFNEVILKNHNSIMIATDLDTKVDKILNSIFDYAEKNKCFFGEVLFRNNTPALDLINDILDILDFKEVGCDDE